MTFKERVIDLHKIYLHTYREWSMDRTIRLGAGIAYYMLIALIPFITLAVGIAGIVFTGEQIQQYTTDIIAETFGGSVESLNTAVESFFTQQELENSLRNLGLVGIAGVIVSISFLVVALQDAVNVMWNIPITRGIRFSIKRYIAAYGVVLFISTLLLATLLIHVLSDAAVALLPGDFELFEWLAELIAAGTSLLLFAGFFGLLIKSLLKVDAAWKHLLIAGLLTSVFIQIGTGLIGQYYETVGVQSVVGVFGSVLVLLGWMYFIAQTLLAGIQLTKVLSYRAGDPKLQKRLKRSDPLL